MSEDVEFIKFIWKSAHAVQDFPGKVTIRRFSPFKKVAVVGEGKTEAEAWRNAVERVEKVTKQHRND
jgi:hypothetical protein